MANPIAQALQPFIWGRGGAALTPEQVAREREIAEALVAQGIDTSPVGHWTQGAARMANVLAGKIREGRAASAESDGRAAYNERLSALFDGAPMASTPPQLGGSPATSTAMATMPAPNSGDLRGGIISTATALGIAPEDLATAISYETAGTFDPTKRGPTTQWGQHRGLIQFGEPQAKQYGVNWDDPLGSQLGPDGAIAKYLRDTGVKPGMGLLDIYSAINAGGVGRYNRSDANNGGAPGTVRDKVEKQMAGHRQKALALLGMNGQTQAPAVAALDALAGGNAAPPSITDAEAKEILSRPRPADAQPYSGPGSIIDPAGVAQLEQTRLEQERAARYAAMPGWMQEMIPQSAAPLSDDQFAVRFATTGGPAPEMRDGSQMPGAQEYVADRMAGMAPSLPEPRMVDDLPVADIARSLTGATLADDRVPMAGGASSFAPVGTQAPNVSLPAGAQFTLPPPQQQVAQSLVQGGGQPSMQQLIELASDPWATPAQRQVVGALLQQQMDAADPYRQAQLEKLRLEMEALRNPAAPKLINAGDGRLYDPGTGQWIVAPVGDQQTFRQAAPEEAAKYGAVGGQFGPDGRFYPINPPAGMNIQMGPDGTFTFEQGPGVQQRPLTEAQSKDAVYATRAEGALPLLDQFGDALADPIQRAAEYDPTGVLRGQQTPEFQQARQAGDEFLQAILRKDTGAAITTGEMESYGRTYLPMPGDGPQVLAQKKVARARALEAMKSGMPPQAILNQEEALRKSGSTGAVDKNKPISEMTDEELEAIANGNG